jgi:hypothetical protein
MSDQMLEKSSGIGGSSGDDSSGSRRNSLAGLWILVGAVATAGWWAGIAWSVIRLAEYALS